MIRDKKRFVEAGKIGLSKADLALNLNQRTLIKEANDLINENPGALLKDTKLLKKFNIFFFICSLTQVIYHKPPTIITLKNWAPVAI